MQRQDQPRNQLACPECGDAKHLMAVLQVEALDPLDPTPYGLLRGERLILDLHTADEVGATCETCGWYSSRRSWRHELHDATREPVLDPDTLERAARRLVDSDGSEIDDAVARVVSAVLDRGWYVGRSVAGVVQERLEASRR